MVDIRRTWLFVSLVLVFKLIKTTISDANTYMYVQIFLTKSGCQDLQCLYSLTPQQIINAVPWSEFPYWDMNDLGDIPEKGHFDGALAVVDGIPYELF